MHSEETYFWATKSYALTFSLPLVALHSKAHLELYFSRTTILPSILLLNYTIVVIKLDFLIVFYFFLFIFSHYLPPFVSSLSIGCFNAVISRNVSKNSTTKSLSLRMGATCSSSHSGVSVNGNGLISERINGELRGDDEMKISIRLAYSVKIFGILFFFCL